MEQPQAGAGRTRVAVVFGGRSPEHAVSCITAAGVVHAMDQDRYEVVPIGITRAGRWVVGSGDGERLAVTEGPLPEVAGNGADVVLQPDPTTRGLLVTSPGEPPQQLAKVDVVFPVLHGPNGEDGTLQGLLELADVRYVGSGVLASAAAMDKHVMKVLLRAAGIPVCRWVTLRAAQWGADPAAVLAAVEPLGWPVFVKPARAGSSFGISKASGPDGLGVAMELAGRYDPRVLVEEAVVGREVECGVLEGPAGCPPDVSVLGEVVVTGGHDFYDFEAKYTDADALELVIPAAVSAEVAEQAQRMARAAFEALGCEGLARIDFFLTEDGTLLLNEVNTMPGFTPSSMFPRVWAASGLDYPALVDRLLTTALRRPLGLR
jgi:D-alanine-D-alanine ligase